MSKYSTCSDAQFSATAAVLTPQGRGAVAVIGFRGDARLLGQPDNAPLFRAANGRPLAHAPVCRVIYGCWGTSPAEEVVICRVAEDRLEIHCHGGRAAVERILHDLQSRGVSVESAVEWTAEREGPLQAECIDILSRTRTLKTAEYALEQANGVLEEAVGRLCQRAETARTERDVQHIQSETDAMLRWAGFGGHLAYPWRVAICGRPNVGKSSLINALMGYERSIVFDQPGTTRDVVTSETALDGWPVELVDTAGLHEADESLEAAGMLRAREVVRTAEVCLLLLDVSHPLTDDDARLVAMAASPLVVAHKWDLPAVWSEADLNAHVAGVHGASTERQYNELLTVSSKTGAGVPELGRQIIRRLIPQVPPPGTAIPVTARQVELLRTARQAALSGETSAATTALREILHPTETAGVVQ